MRNHEMRLLVVMGALLALMVALQRCNHPGMPKKITGIAAGQQEAPKPSPGPREPERFAFCINDGCSIYDSMALMKTLKKVLSANGLKPVREISREQMIIEQSNARLRQGEAVQQ